MCVGVYECAFISSQQKAVRKLHLWEPHGATPGAQACDHQLRASEDKEGHGQIHSDLPSSRPPETTLLFPQVPAELRAGHRAGGWRSPQRTVLGWAPSL